jgi:methyl-accepting chemotaxis protein
LDQVLQISRQMTNNAKANRVARDQMDPALTKYLSLLSTVRNNCDDSEKKSFEAVQSAASDTQLGSFWGVIASLVLGGILAYFIIRSTNAALNDIAGKLRDGSSQVASAASHIASSSQSLAEGASEQAASLEETSSSLEEMSSMTKSNTESARKAKDLAAQARHAADAGTADMQAMNTAMAAIKQSSSEIGKIIKTIDEIAFQTNILALNAAVEAARAGEAGMGFAVVADEVRNLAQRSAQAAKETAAKIEGAITKTDQGVQISAKVSEVLQEIVAKVREVDQLVAEVATASQEQSQGIEQLNTAVNQMDRVTQSNAASAEESASASEQLSAQSESLKQAVDQLLAMVGGAGANTLSRKVPARESSTVRTIHVETHSSVIESKPSRVTLDMSNPKPGSKKKSDLPMDEDFV